MLDVLIKVTKEITLKEYLLEECTNKILLRNGIFYIVNDSDIDMASNINDLCDILYGGSLSELEFLEDKDNWIRISYDDNLDQLGFKEYIY